MAHGPDMPPPQVIYPARPSFRTKTRRGGHMTWEKEYTGEGRCCWSLECAVSLDSKETLSSLTPPLSQLFSPIGHDSFLGTSLERDREKNSHSTQKPEALYNNFDSHQLCEPIGCHSKTCLTQPVFALTDHLIGLLWPDSHCLILAPGG